MSKINILVVDDEPIIARDLASTLAGIDYQVSDICFSVKEAMAALKTKSPDFAILDINLGKEEDGISIGAFIHQHLHFPFIYLTSYADRATVEKAKHTMPMGYLVKPFEEPTLFTTIEIALFNFANLYHPKHFDLEKINSQLLSKITPKEFEILLDINAGHTNQQLSEKHFISINTVKTHIKNIFSKLDVTTRSELMVKLRYWEKKITRVG